MMGSSLVMSLVWRLVPYLGLLAAAGWIYLQGQWSAQNKAELATAKATIIVLEETTRRNALAAEAATQAANRRALNERLLQNRIENYEDALKARSSTGCLLDDDDARRLHELD
jgi:hypothetical protein